MLTDEIIIFALQIVDMNRTVLLRKCCVLLGLIILILLLLHLLDWSTKLFVVISFVWTLHASWFVFLIGLHKIISIVVTAVVIHSVVWLLLQLLLRHQATVNNPNCIAISISSWYLSIFLCISTAVLRVTVIPS